MGTPATEAILRPFLEVMAAIHPLIVAVGGWLNSATLYDRDRQALGRGRVCAVGEVMRALSSSLSWDDKSLLNVSNGMYV